MININIRRKVKRIFDETTIYEPFFNIREYCQSIGVQVHEVILDDDISGALDLRDELKPTIYVNSIHTSERKRFTIGHELGHYHMHAFNQLHLDKSIYFRENINTNTNLQIEFEANSFSAEFLMPFENVKNNIFDIGNRSENHQVFIENMAKIYRVSNVAMTIRLNNIFNELGIPLY